MSVFTMQYISINYTLDYIFVGIIWKSSSINLPISRHLPLMTISPKKSALTYLTFAKYWFPGYESMDSERIGLFEGKFFLNAGEDEASLFCIISPNQSTCH